MGRESRENFILQVMLPQVGWGALPLCCPHLPRVRQKKSKVLFCCPSGKGQDAALLSALTQGRAGEVRRDCPCSSHNHVPIRMWRVAWLSYLKSPCNCPLSAYSLPHSVYYNQVGVWDVCIYPRKPTWRGCNGWLQLVLPPYEERGRKEGRMEGRKE